MVVAGEPSGDMLAAELVQALRSELVSFQARTTSDVQPLFASLEPIFFGAGGPRMAAAGVDLNVDMTVHSVIGLIDVFTRLGQFVVLRERLKNLAIQRQPDVIICVDYAGFNRRLARAIKDHIRANQGTFRNWNPKMVQFISPQVWASRPGRTKSMAQDLDLLISIFPFEKAWYAGRVPQLKVEYVGHPMLDRYARPEGGEQSICARPDGHPPLPLRGGEGRGENSSNDSSRIDPMNRGDLASKTSENSPSPIGWERAGVRVRGEG
ncbi:MAG: hypothetical protein NTW03_19690, partial [Verrucomicrobia bacterium]|nr:hypothetical protein [Verrucomicrobiota bacterium]